MWEYMDVEQVAMYWAVDRALGLNDGPVHFRWFRGRVRPSVCSVRQFRLTESVQLD